jgi:hypothetical protein
MDNIIPIEVKAAENLKAKSLKSYYEQFKPITTIRTSLSNYIKEEWLNYLSFICAKYGCSGLTISSWRSG